MNDCKIAVNGILGKMGSTVAKLILKEKSAQLVQGIEVEDSPYLGKDVGKLLGGAEIDVRLSNSLQPNADVLIDFSTPQATLKRVEECIKLGTNIVVGTTGFKDDELEKMKSASKKIAVLVSPNMSYGMNVVFKLLENISRLLYDNYDVEIVEVHHNQKKDSPSGTAIRLAEKIKNSTDNEREMVFGRKSQRTGKEINIHSLRTGNVIGRHSVLFSGNYETIEISHIAESRETFAAGAIKSALFLKDKKSGFYSFEEVLLKE